MVNLLKIIDYPGNFDQKSSEIAQRRTHVGSTVRPVGPI